MTQPARLAGTAQPERSSSAGVAANLLCVLREVRQSKARGRQRSVSTGLRGLPPGCLACPAPPLAAPAPLSHRTAHWGSGPSVPHVPQDCPAPQPTITGAPLIVFPARRGSRTERKDEHIKTMVELGVCASNVFGMSATVSTRCYKLLACQILESVQLLRMPAGSTTNLTPHIMILINQSS